VYLRGGYVHHWPNQTCPPGRPGWAGDKQGLTQGFLRRGQAGVPGWGFPMWEFGAKFRRGWDPPVFCRQFFCFFFSILIQPKKPACCFVARRQKGTRQRDPGGQISLAHSDTPEKNGGRAKKKKKTVQIGSGPRPMGAVGTVFTGGGAPSAQRGVRREGEWRCGRCFSKKIANYGIV